MNSRARWVPAAIGAVNRGHRAAQARASPGSERDAGLASVSCTAAVNRAHRSAVSWGVVFGSGWGAYGGRERIVTYSEFVYGGKYSCGVEDTRRMEGDGVVRMKMVVKLGICVYS